jgi:hypothetical protein
MPEMTQEAHQTPNSNLERWRQFKTLSFVSILAVISTLCVSCNEEPTTVGIGLLSSKDLVQVDTSLITSVTGSSYKKPINTGSSENILVGKYRTETGKTYESEALIRFTGFPDTLKSATVLSADLILRSRYRFGEPQGNLSFTVHKMIQGWTEYGVTWDSISTASYDPTVRGSFSSAIADSDSVAISLDPSLISDWFQAAADSQAIDGIILVPTDASNKIVGFSSFQFSDASRLPELLVVFLSSDTSTVQDSLLFVSGADTHVANIDNLASDPNLLYVQAGVAYRSTVDFDVSSVPTHVGIHQAMLELTLNPSTSILSSTSSLTSQSVDSLFSFFLVTTDSVDNSSWVIGHRLNPDSAVYSFLITSDVQRWINGKANLGVEIETWAEVSTLDLFTFYLNSANPSLRPRLRIVYSRQL